MCYNADPDTASACFCRADFFTLAVRTGAQGASGLSLLLVDAKTPGVKVRSGLKQTSRERGKQGLI